MTGLDATTAARVMEPLRRLMSGRTTILITHDLRFAPDAARRIELGAGRHPGGARLARSGVHGRTPHRS
jgi:ATP-binding cassette subfamily B protein